LPPLPAPPHVSEPPVTLAADAASTTLASDHPAPRLVHVDSAAAQFSAPVAR